MLRLCVTALCVALKSETGVGGLVWTDKQLGFQCAIVLFKQCYKGIPLFMFQYFLQNSNCLLSTPTYCGMN